MFQHALSLCISLALLTTNASARLVANYEDPYANSKFLSTVTARLLKARRLQPRTFQLAPLPGRSNTPIIGGQAGLPVSYYAQSSPAPLAFLITGTGGSASEGAAHYLGENLYSQGYSVILLPSPFSWNFALSQSTTGIPGYAPADAEDLYRVMQQALARVAQETGARPTSYALAGYSLGAVHAAFVRQMDRKRKEFNFTRVALINPPLSLAYATGKIDQMNDAGKKWNREERDRAWGQAISAGQAFLSRDINDPSYFLGLDRTPLVDQATAEYLIGNSLRDSLAEMIVASQQVNDTGLLKSPATQSGRTARKSEAARISFTSYSQNVLYPFWKKQLGLSLSFEQLLARGDLSGIEKELLQDNAVYLLQNLDDFLVLPADQIRLDREFGARSYLFPAGGHIGNLWNPAHVAAMRAIFSLGR